MATRSLRKGAPDKRHQTDRRTNPRESDGRKGGRRATDAPPAASPVDGPGGLRKRRSTRDGREPLVVYLRPEAIKALKMAALEGDTTASAIIAETVDAWLRTNGRPPRR